MPVPTRATETTTVFRTAPRDMRSPWHPCPGDFLCGPAYPNVDIDGVEGLSDVVLAMKILAGYAENTDPDADMDGEGKVGMTEIGNILRSICD